ncbi:hypothetical protein A2U01_0074494, partial [Trifolium medium]|nr:hypothetical protein [Trifolium medium]
MQRLGIRPSL